MEEGEKRPGEHKIEDTPHHPESGMDGRKNKKPIKKV